MAAKKQSKFEELRQAFHDELTAAIDDLKRERAELEPAAERAKAIAIAIGNMEKSLASMDHVRDLCENALKLLGVEAEPVIVKAAPHKKGGES
jgi:hypothetical protein